MLLILSLMLSGAPEIPRLREDSVIYEIDPDRFGTGLSDDTGLDSIVKHIDYIRGLGISAVAIAAKPASLKSDEPAIRELNNAEIGAILPLGAQVPPKSAVGWIGRPADERSAPPPPRRWIGGFSTTNARKQISPGGLSSVSDDRWRQDVLAFLRDETITPSQFDKTIKEFRNGYDDVADRLMTRLTPPTGPRVKSELRGDIRKLAQAWVMLFTLPGIPVVEFGDEIGLSDSSDQMNWDQTSAQKSNLSKIQLLIALRRQRPSLYRGSYEVIVKDDENHIFGFERHDRFESTLVFLNNSDLNWSEQVPAARFGTNPLNDLLGSGTSIGHSSLLSVYIPAHGAVVMGN